MESVSLWEVQKWECPVCCEDNQTETRVNGDEVTCESCGETFVVDGVCSACRPESDPKPKRKAVRRGK